MMMRSQNLQMKFATVLFILLFSRVVICNFTLKEKHDKENQYFLSGPLSERNNTVLSNTNQSKFSSGSYQAKTNLENHTNSSKNLHVKDKKSSEENHNINSPDEIHKNITINRKPADNATKVVDGIHKNILNAGALKRGFYVLIGLSVLVIAYFVFRSFRVSNQRAQMIRKYGILAHRQDMEMRPLPLDEDDEDDTTVFDASNITYKTNPLNSNS